MDRPFTKKLYLLAVEAGIVSPETPCDQAASEFIRTIRAMNAHFGIGNSIPEIRKEDIPKLAHYADKEANPLYPVPVLMDAKELAKFYDMLLEEHHDSRRN